MNQCQSGILLISLFLYKVGEGLSTLNNVVNEIVIENDWHNGAE